ncbi:MAG: hypothetical protein NT007_18410 [Candidatus Kapabacteria bacterium]|nr:hypothetical protein [Candidatus Kapabacteria bacterium]
MQKSDEDKIFTLLQSVSVQTKEITKYLEEMDYGNSININKLSELYSRRENNLEILNKFCKSKYWSDFYKNNHIEWEDVYQPLVRADKGNLDILEKSVKIISEKLRILLKKKSILVYTREVKK